MRRLASILSIKGLLVSLGIDEVLVILEVVRLGQEVVTVVLILTVEVNKNDLSLVLFTVGFI